MTVRIPPFLKPPTSKDSTYGKDDHVIFWGVCFFRKLNPQLTSPYVGLQDQPTYRSVALAIFSGFGPGCGPAKNKVGPLQVVTNGEVNPTPA